MPCHLFFPHHTKRAVFTVMEQKSVKTNRCNGLTHPFPPKSCTWVLYFTYLSKNCLQRTGTWLSVDNSPQHPKRSVVLKFLRDDQLHEILRYIKQTKKKSVNFETHCVKTNKTYIFICTHVLSSCYSIHIKILLQTTQSSFIAYLCH